jgi:glyoxylase-like metal-dependent hydrolase (beta-lactamase superfamily II)
MKAGWVRRNGIPYSDRATFTDTWQRHGNFLTHVSMLEDPVYLTEPFVRTTNWVFDPTQRIEAYPCEIVTEVVGHELGYVPHYLPGTNTQLADFAKKHNLSQEAARGGADTALPEFVRRPRPGNVEADLKVGPYNPTVGAGLQAGPLQAGPLQAGPLQAGPLQAGPRKLEILHVQGNVHLIATGRVNIVVQAGNDGVMVVDTGSEEMADEVLAAIEKIAPGKPIRYIVNTSVDPDHTGGNEQIGRRGESLAGGDFARNISDAGQGANVVAHENVLVRMGKDRNGRARPFKAWPTDTFIAAKKEIFFNGEAIQILHQPAAHTDGDVMVFFRKSDVLVTGDVFVTTGYPSIDVEQGGSIGGEIAALNQIIDVTVPRLNQEGGTYVVPGHGRIADESDVVDYRDMVTIIRDRIAEMIRTGTITEQVMAARPTFEYDPRYNNAADGSAREGFAYTVYHNLRR